MTVDVLYYHAAVLSLGRQEGGDITHCHAPVYLYARADAPLAKHHIHSHRTAIPELLQVLFPPLADVQKHLRVGILHQPLQFLTLGSHPVT